MIDVLRPNYAAYEILLSQVKHRYEVWRLLLGAFVIVLAYLLVSQVYFAFTLNTLAGGGTTNLADDLASGATPIAMYLLLFQFGAIWIAVGIACSTVHKRHLNTVFGSVSLTLNQFARVIGALALLGLAVTILPPWSGDIGYIQVKPVGQWLLLLPISLLALFIQVGAEELLFRGYLQQQLAARFRSPAVWILIPSVLFAFGHYMPNMAGENAWTIVIWAGMFGILMADLTARAGSLGPAMAVHFLNNLSALIIVSLPDQMSGLSLYHTPFGMDDTEAVAQWLPVDFAFMIVMWLTARLVIRR